MNILSGFLGPAILALLRIGGPPTSGIPSIGNYHDVDRSPEHSRCYDIYSDHGNSAPGASPSFIQNDNRRRYFALFSRKAVVPSGGRAGPPMANPLFACWNQQYGKRLQSITQKIGRHQMFASYHPPHAEAVAELGEMILENIDKRDMLHSQIMDFLEFLQDRGDIHPQLYLHSTAYAEVGARSPLVSFATPALPEMFPSRFLPNIVPKALSSRLNDKTCLKVNDLWGATATNGIENRLWYFREDLQLNNHHWNWHLHHPARSSFQLPRRGESFYFFHHELVARYSTERIVNGFKNYNVGGVIPVPNYLMDQGYDSNLRDGVSTQNWVNRPNNTRLNETTLYGDAWRRLLFHKNLYDNVKRITESGQVMDKNNKSIPLIPDGVNILGELFESSNWTINEYFYGDIGWHNTAHDILASVNLTVGQQDFGVLGDVATAVRDMYFFHIHGEVNDMFQRYKHNMVKPYELNKGDDHPLILPGIVTKGIKVMGANDNVNNLTTFWNNHNMVLDGGLDILPNKVMKLAVCLKHLDHEEFTYNLELENTGDKKADIFVRIFMAPRYDPYGKRFNFSEQAKLFFTLDTFPLTISPGTHKFVRASQDSSVTVPWYTPSRDDPEVDEGACTCGYPHHMLIPKGSDDNKGIYDIVVMVTSGSDYTGKEGDFCHSSYVHCGKPQDDYEYPDSKPMGYPWDRRPMDSLKDKYLDDFVKLVPNIGQTTINIVHNDNNPPEHVI